VDGRTDRAVAQEAVASGRHERFTWIEVSHFDAVKRDEVLTHLSPDGHASSRRTCRR
jgi:hypothetical protein